MPSPAQVTVEMLADFAAAWNRHDLDALLSFMTEDGAFHAVAGPGLLGRSFVGTAALREGFALAWQTFPDASWTERWREVRYPFVYGGHDPQLFPTEDFRECCARSLARAQLPNWTPDFETDDVPDLIEQIRLQLLPKRGVFALAEEIVVTVGAQQAFHLLADALFDSRSRVGFEEPGYPHARNSFALREPRWVPLPLRTISASASAMSSRIQKSLMSWPWLAAATMGLEPASPSCTSPLAMALMTSPPPPNMRQLIL